MNYLSKPCPKKILMSWLLLWTTQAQAQAIYGYKDGAGQLFLTNIQQNTSGNAKFTEIGVTYYPDTKLHQNGQLPSTYNPTTASAPSRSANKNAFDSIIKNAAMRYGVEAALVKAIIHTESAFNPNARSPVGAMGLMQLMPGTARDMGVGNAYNPSQNIDGGVKYLAWLQRQFNNLDHVIAAYNAGHGNVRKYGGIPPFRETRNYVQSVNARLRTLYRNDASLLNAPIATNNMSVNPVSSATPIASSSPAVIGNTGRVYVNHTP